eukprot:TRINITY_DN7095_c0_g1_i5.p1 TRINITY_DN7095_c0_g1~~TRINITY_DN7095_c0_g1_i5.p1  ORF type:complete len:217 (-),score=27.70 TRINITY_DN7095_c0_g1_i5:110-760(-)
MCIRDRDAIAYIKKYASAYPNHFDDIKKAMGCLLISPKLEKFPQYRDYFDDNRWNYLIELFKKDLYNIFSILSQSMLTISLQAGLSSLKTIYCYNEHNRKVDRCPVCHPNFQKLSQPLPYTHKTHSSLICRVTGEVMDEHNPPIALPNQHVYSQKAINDIADSNDGMIVCPETKKEYKLEQVQKIYLSQEPSSPQQLSSTCKFRVHQGQLIILYFL